MDRNRLLLAFVLMMIVAIAPSIIWPSKKPAGRPVGPTAGDTTKAAQVDTGNVIAPRPSGRPAVAESDTGRVVLVTSPLYRLGFSTKGGPKVRGACGKVNLDRRVASRVTFPALLEEIYGSDVPAAQSAAHQ